MGSLLGDILFVETRNKGSLTVKQQFRVDVSSTETPAQVLKGVHVESESRLELKGDADITVKRECQDFCVWGGYSRGSPTRLPFVFEMQYARPDAIAGAKVEGPARSAGGSSLAPAIARREAAGALAREV